MLTTSNVTGYVTASYVTGYVTTSNVIGYVTTSYVTGYVAAPYVTGYVTTFICDWLLWLLHMWLTMWLQMVRMSVVDYFSAQVIDEWHAMARKAWV